MSSCCFGSLYTTVLRWKPITAGPLLRHGRPGRLLPRPSHSPHRSLLKHLPCKAGGAATVPRPNSSWKEASASFLNIPSINNAQRLPPSGGWGTHVSGSLLLAQQEGRRRTESSSGPSAVMPKAPPEWQPPTDPSGPPTLPEFTPPREPGIFMQSSMQHNFVTVLMHAR